MERHESWEQRAEGKQQPVRLAILADVHGNLPALEAVLTDVRRHAVDGIVVAGDLVGGPQSIEVVRRLDSLGSWMIRGNGDNYFLTYDAGLAPAGWHESKQWAPLRWVYRHLDRATLDLLAALPETRSVALDGISPIRVVHGSPRDPAERLYPDRDPATLEAFRSALLLGEETDPPRLEMTLVDVEETVLICGHTHIPWKQEQNGQLAFNPGAVCGPLNGETRAQYALLTWENGRWQVQHRAVPYDLRQVRADFRESGFLEEGGGMARSLLLNVETGRNIPGFLLAHAHRLAAEAGHAGCEVVPDDVWDRALASFNWEDVTGGENVACH